MHKIRVFDICLIAVLAAITLALEYLLLGIPNVRLTVLLLVLYSKKLGIIKTTLIIIIYSLVDCLINGGIHYVFYPVMLLGWLIIPLSLNTIFKKIEEPLYLGLLGVLFSFIYCWMYILPTILIMDMKFIPYLLSDIPFEIILATSSFLSILWLYKPLSSLFDKILK